MIEGLNLRSRSLVVFALMLMLLMALASSFADHSDSTDPGDDGRSFGIMPFGELANRSIEIIFFYQAGCPHCAAVEPHVDSVVARYPQASLVKLEISHNNTNWILFQEYNARFNVQDPRVPSIQIGNESLVGEEAIQADLEPIIVRLISAGDAPPDQPGANNTGPNGTADANDTSGNDTAVPPEEPPGPVDTGPSIELTIFTVIAAAAVDSINPCAISVMIFLLIFLTSLGDKKRVVIVGLVYIVTVFIVYFMAGLGLLVFLQSLTMTRLVYNVAAVVSIAVGLVNIAEFFIKRDKPTLAIPESRKPLIKRYIAMASIPAAVVLGIVVSLFELPCTGAIYFAILNLLNDSMTFAQGIPYLALYNLIFVLPLAGILAVVVLGVSADRANSWRLKNRSVLRLAIGLIMVGLGAMMLLGMF